MFIVSLLEFLIFSTRLAKYLNDNWVHFISVVSYMVRSIKTQPKGKIEKPEDKLWREWFEKIPENGHDEYLQKLGLDQSDIQEWHTSRGKILESFNEVFPKDGPKRVENKK